MVYKRKLHVITRGKRTNPPLILLHGYLGSSADWLETAQQLKKDYFVIMPDLPGHGKSINLKRYGGYRFKDFAHYFQQIMEKFKLEHCYLGGYSLGGRLALYLATEFPQQIKKLILISASPGLESKAERDQRQEADQKKWMNFLWVEIGFLEQKTMEDFVHLWYQQPLFKRFMQIPKIEEILKRRYENDPTEASTSLMCMSLGVQPPLWEELKTLEMPVCLMVGAEDHKFLELAHQMKSLLPNSELQVIQDCGHVVYAEQPQSFVQTVKVFLR